MPKDSGIHPPKRELDFELDLLESRIAELKVRYEQYFVGVLGQAPDKEQEEVSRLIKRLLKAPFKNSATRFRLRTLVQRFQTYSTYWERVKKERDEGKYARDVFKAELREKQLEQEKRELSKAGIAEQGLKQLYQSYENASKKAGIKADNLNFSSFKKSLISKAKELQKRHGAKKLRYKVIVRDGKVVVKASAKD